MTKSTGVGRGHYTRTSEMNARNSQRNKGKHYGFGNKNCLGKQNGLKHGMSGTRTYISWMQMKARCNNPKATGYKNWGGRGIIVCEAWLTFAGFYASMGERPEGKTLDRYPNPDGNYEPGNCRWATTKEQRSNHRESN